MPVVANSRLKGGGIAEQVLELGRLFVGATGGATL
jgi:hypothetical protein